jgi:hypothetical protein
MSRCFKSDERNAKVVTEMGNIFEGREGIVVSMDEGDSVFVSSSKELRNILIDDHVFECSEIGCMSMKKSIVSYYLRISCQEIRSEREKEWSKQTHEMAGHMSQKRI